MTLSNRRNKRPSDWESRHEWCGTVYPRLKDLSYCCNLDREPSKKRTGKKDNARNTLFEPPLDLATFVCIPVVILSSTVCHETSRDNSSVPDDSKTPRSPVARARYDNHINYHDRQKLPEGSSTFLKVGTHQLNHSATRLLSPRSPSSVKIACWQANKRAK